LVISSSDRNELNEGYKRKLIHILNVLRFWVEIWCDSR
jgi:hypothetical protein